MSVDINRAVVLGGGGATGLAWEIGVLEGLREDGIDLNDNARVLFGTSAGAFAATLVASGADIKRRFDDQFEDDAIEIAITMAPDLALQYQEAVDSSGGDAISLSKAYGQIARSSKTVTTDARLKVVRHRLGTDKWPSKQLRLTAIDADTGELVVLDSSSGISLTDAANASGAVPGIWPMVSAGGRNWIDGGMISAANVELGAGFDRVLVIAPVVAAAAQRDSVDVAAAKLSKNATVVVISPDSEALAAIGPNVFDPERRGAAALAGQRQARSSSDEIRARWLR